MLRIRSKLRKSGAYWGHWASLGALLHHIPVFVHLASIALRPLSDLLVQILLFSSVDLKFPRSIMGDRIYWESKIFEKYYFQFHRRCTVSTFQYSISRQITAPHRHPVSSMADAKHFCPSRIPSLSMAGGWQSSTLLTQLSHTVRLLRLEQLSI